MTEAETKSKVISIPEKLITDLFDYIAESFYNEDIKNISVLVFRADKSSASKFINSLVKQGEPNDLKTALAALENETSDWLGHLSEEDIHATFNTLAKYIDDNGLCSDRAYEEILDTIAKTLSRFPSDAVDALQAHLKTEDLVMMIKKMFASL
jgi:vacuolar-type H+-ATPase subunit C/Vma6